MKKQSSYFVGVCMLIVSLVIYAIPFGIASAILSMVILSIAATSEIKDVGVLGIVILVINHLASIGTAYFGIKNFLKNKSTPNNKKLVNYTLVVILLLDLVITLIMGKHTLLAVSVQFVQTIVVYLVVLYSIKKNFVA